MLLGMVLPLLLSSTLAEVGSGNKTVQVADDQRRT